MRPGMGVCGVPPVGHSLPPAPMATLLLSDLSKLLPLLGLCTCCPSTWKSPHMWPGRLLLVYVSAQRGLSENSPDHRPATSYVLFFPHLPVAGW